MIQPIFIFISARPSLYHCSVIVQSLFGTALKFWQSNRRSETTSTPAELHTINRILYIFKQVGYRLIIDKLSISRQIVRSNFYSLTNTIEYW